MNITDMNCTADEHLTPLLPQLTNDTAKGSARGEQSETDTARIILQLEQNHAEANAAVGLPSGRGATQAADLGLAEADDPKAVIAHVAELLCDHAENKAYLPKLIQECERLGLALQRLPTRSWTSPKSGTIDGRRTVVARADEVAVAYDDVQEVGRCLTCSGELDDTALLHFPANARPSAALRT